MRMGLNTRATSTTARGSEPNRADAPNPSPATRAAVVLVGLMLTSISASSCTSHGDESNGPETPGAALTVLYDDEPAQASFSGMLTGEYATFDGPYVCVDGDQPVRLVGVEFDPADSGIDVTDIGVTPTGDAGPTPVTAKKRLRDLPQAAVLTADDMVTGSCESAPPAAVWMELRKTRGGDLGVVRTRYVYEVGGATVRTPWFPKGYALTE